MTKVSAVIVEDLHAQRIPGAIRFYRFGDETAEGEPAGLLFRCPCGCDQIGSIAFRQYEGQGPVWMWNGSKEKPTCTPSIGFYGMNERSQGHHWHGYLTEGEFVPC